MKTIIVISALLLLVSPVFAGNAGNKEFDRKQIYELQEKCSQSVRQFLVEEDNQYAKDGSKRLRWAAHYNVRFNWCLVEETREYPDTVNSLMPSTLQEKRKVTTVTNVLEHTTIASCTNGGDNFMGEEHFKSYDECIIRWVNEFMFN